MKNFVLILALAAMAYGGHSYHKQNPDLLDQMLDKSGLQRKERADSDESEADEGSKKRRGSRKAVTTISRGKNVELKDHADPDGRTVFEFTADW